MLAVTESLPELIRVCLFWLMFEFRARQTVQLILLTLIRTHPAHDC